MNPSPEFVFIAGASRGIGNGFADALLARNSVHTVFCAARSAANNPALTQLARSHPQRVVALDLDIADEASVRDCAARVSDLAPRLDWIINTVGLLHDGDDMRPERQLADVQPGNIIRSFEVNSMGPLLLAKHLSRLLPRREPCTVATLSARVGSISDNRLGGWYAYRASKAAQNMLTRTLSIELKRKHRRIRCVALHPGTVATDLSAPFRGGVDAEKLFSIEQSTNYLLQVLDQLDDDDNGKFFAWDGQKIDW